ncbi:aminomethyl-transferring glycine dehydrogenase subunit GcvPA [Thermotoga sp.]|uniref:aminomethyl-transferring glycine dehydrogenase subunit GcvPA n=1 Tax=Thermotoga sp. TaxID=28240 RepID=UPI0025DF7E5C|nr:aminomethyl-transferring glycine dehydrogenase subunit GcvPA [Thermotoga sp.]MCD6550992.1 aminomethyl-transferring glycine dehydrogenase subunit GcvPA [Thermotoga sp.]
MKYPYIPHTEEDIREMLDFIGVSSIEDLFSGIPNSTRSSLNLPESQDEFTVFDQLKRISEKNVDLEEYSVFLGAGVYKRYVPSVVYDLAMKPEFLTAYTPYQAEVSQGTLQALFEYQTMICELTGMEVANASMYDGATALAEAVLMCFRLTKKEKVLVARSVHPEYREVLKTYLETRGFKMVEAEYDEAGRVVLEGIDDETAAVVVQYPNFFGVIEDLDYVRRRVQNTLIVVVVEPVSLAVLEPPGSFGADIVVGEGQSLGIPMWLGGYSLGIFATRERYVRQMPGRLIGETVDVEGNVSYTMILQTREQHIRRSKATSNICSNHAHAALIASVYLSVMGPEGLKEVAKRSYDAAHYLQEKLEEKGFRKKFSSDFFSEFVFKVPEDYPEKWKKMMKRKILGPLPLEKVYPELSGTALACATEVITEDDIERLLEAMG